MKQKEGSGTDPASGFERHMPCQPHCSPHAALLVAESKKQVIINKPIKVLLQ